MSYREITTSQAKFRFIYRVAGEMGWKRDLPVNFDAAFIEVMHAQPEPDPDKRWQKYIDFMETDPELANLRARVKENGARVYFGDLADSGLFSASADTAAMFFQGVAGIGLWWQSLRRRPASAKKNLWSRVVLFLGGVWLLAGAVELLGFLVIRFPGQVWRRGGRAAWAETLARLSNLHPEKPLVFLRNLILAEKIWEAVELEKKKVRMRSPRMVRRGLPQAVRKPFFVLDFHFGHAGLLPMLAWHRRHRRWFFRLYRPFIASLRADPVQMDYLTRLTSVRWQGSHWGLIHSFRVDALDSAT